LNDLIAVSHEENDIVDLSSVDLVESDSVDSIKELLEVVLNGIWIRTDRKNLQKIGVGAEVESWEDVSLVLKIVLKLLLTDLKTFLEASKGVKKDVVGAALNDILLLVGSLHDLKPLLVNTLELLGHDWHVLGNISGCEYRDQVGP